MGENEIVAQLLRSIQKGATNIVDLSSVLGTNTTCYPTDPPFEKNWHSQIPSDSSNVSLLKTGLHAGTHVDVPLHFMEYGKDICQMHLEHFVGNAIAIGVEKKPGEDILAADIAHYNVRRGDIVFLHTGWSNKSNTPSFYDPFWNGLSTELVDRLINIGIKAVGLDTPSADNGNEYKTDFYAHKALLKADIPIYESLVNLDCIIGKRFLFVGLPLRIENAEASPVRAIAIL